MGCGASIHPSIYNETNKLNGNKPKEKFKQPIRSEDPRHLRGDYSQLQVTRHERNTHIKTRRSKTFEAANEMSGKIIEEREMLSLGTRSRGTSRNTSRATSPTQTKKMLQNSEDRKLPMTPVTESRATSNISHRSKEVTGETIQETDISQNTGKKTTKRKKEKSKSKISPDVNQNIKTNDENEPVLNDVKAVPIREDKAKPKKHSGKQKGKHRKHKKHKKGKSDIVEDINGADIEDDVEDSADEETNEVAVAKQNGGVTHSDKNGHSDQKDKKSQITDEPGILNDITNTEHNMDVLVPGIVPHVHFSDDVTSRIRTASTPELDSKRG